MNKIIFPLLAVLLFATASYAQEKKKENPWKTLSKITFKQQYDEFMGFDVDVPVFSQVIKDLEGKEIEIEGYIIPVEGYKQQSNFETSSVVTIFSRTVPVFFSVVKKPRTFCGRYKKWQFQPVLLSWHLIPHDNSR